MNRHYISKSLKLCPNFAPFAMQTHFNFCSNGRGTPFPLDPFPKGVRSPPTFGDRSMPLAVVGFPLTIEALPVPNHLYSANLFHNNELTHLKSFIYDKKVLLGVKIRMTVSLLRHQD